MKKRIDISVVIPAYNEEGNIREAVRAVARVLSRLSLPYEIIVVDDGSSDGTRAIARFLVGTHPNLRVTANAVNRGFGFSFMKGVRLARGTYVTVFPSDNEMAASSFLTLVQARSRADLITSYPDSPQMRTPLRRVLSSLFTIGMNRTFGLSLRYFNGPVVCRTAAIGALPIVSDRYTIFAEIIVRLVSAGFRYQEVPFVYVPRRHGRSKAVTIPSILSTVRVYCMLVRDVVIAKKHYKHPFAVFRCHPRPASSAG